MLRCASPSSVTPACACEPTLRRQLPKRLFNRRGQDSSSLHRALRAYLRGLDEGRRLRHTFANATSAFAEMQTSLILHIQWPGMSDKAMQMLVAPTKRIL